MIIIDKTGARTISDEEYHSMLKRRSSEYIQSQVLKRALADEVTGKRFSGCKACENLYDMGSKCRHYRGDCFQCWRLMPESKCPAGKW